MKLTVTALRHLIREELKGLNLEELREYAGLSEGYKVKYIGKDGKPAQATFPNERLANMYASTLKGATVEIDGAEMPDIAVQKVAPAGIDDMRASSKAFYRQAQSGEKFAPRAAAGASTASSAENDAELEAEFWMDSRAVGQSQEDAFADLDYIRSRGHGVREAVTRVKVRDLVSGQFFSRDLPFVRNFKVKAMGTDSDGFIILTTTDWMGHNAQTHLFDPELEVFVGE